MSEGHLFLFCWNEAEAEEAAKQLRASGWSVDLEWEDGARGSAAVKALSQPSQCRIPGRDKGHPRYPAHLRGW